MSGMVALGSCPDEGRGPVGKFRVIARLANQFNAPNWAPAFAGEQLAACGGARG